MRIFEILYRGKIRVIGVQMKKVFGCLCKFRLHSGVDPLIFLATLFCLWSVVSAQSSPSWDCGQQCSQKRELVTTVWGGAISLFVLAFDLYSLAKLEVGSTKLMKFLAFDLHSPAKPEVGSKKLMKVLASSGIWLMAVLHPVFLIFIALPTAVRAYVLCSRLDHFKNSSLLPWKENKAKLLISCDVVVNVPTTISIPDEFVDREEVKLSKALVLGRGEESCERKDVHLNDDGVVLLLGLKILPPYEQLKVLQRDTGLATIVSAVQSIGYFFGVVARTTQGIPVSPIEVIGVTFSIVILIKASIHNIMSICPRPLQFYLTSGQASKLVGMCRVNKPKEVPEIYGMVPLVVMILLVTSVVICYISYMWSTTKKIMIIPILFTLVGLYLEVLCVILFWALSKSEGSEGRRSSEDSKIVDPKTASLEIVGPKIDSLEAVDSKIDSLEVVDSKIDSLEVDGPKIVSLEVVDSKIDSSEVDGPKVASLEIVDSKIDPSEVKDIESLEDPKPESSNNEKLERKRLEILAKCLLLLSSIINATSYVLAVVFTFKYWTVERFDAKTSSMLPQIIPYIG